jgi:ankyrin repeat protein
MHREDGLRILLKAVAMSLALILAQEGALHADTENVENEFLDAAFRGRTEAVNKLLAKGADPNARDDIGQTALMGAARNGHVKTVLVLLAAGAAGAAVDVKLHATHWTALLLAAFYGHAEVVKALLAHGADPKVTDSEGKTALTWARIKGHRQVVVVFEEAGVTE